MSALPAISIRHHVYGSTQRGFATLLEPEGGVDRRELVHIERRCGYALPSRLTNDETVERPVKHTCYTVGETLVLGRSVYLGVDRTGRRGNYLTHNLLFPKADAISLFEDPLSLIAQIEQAGLFLGAPPAEGQPAGPSSYEFSDELSPASPLSEATVRALLTLCSGWDPKMPPALLLGTDEEIRGALAAALRVLPHSIRWNVPFDTYVLGADWRELAAIGLPAEREYQGAVNAYSLTIDVAADTAEWKREVPEASLVPHLLYLRSATDDQRGAFFSLIDLLESGNWPEVVENLALVDERSKRVLYQRYRSQVTSHISSTADLSVFDGFSSVMSPSDIDSVAATQGFAGIARLPKYADVMFDTAIDVGPQSRMLPWIARDLGLLQPFLANRVAQVAASQRVLFLATLLRTIPTDADSRAEEAVLIDALKAVSQQGAAASAPNILAAIKSLPPTTGARQGLRLYAALQFGDRDAYAGLLEPQMLVATLKSYPWMLNQLIVDAVRTGQHTKAPLGALFSAAATGELKASDISASCQQALMDPRVDAGSRKRFARDVLGALKSVGPQPWADHLASVAEESGGGGFGSLFKGGRS